MNIYIKSFLPIILCISISIPCFAQNSGIRKIDRKEEKGLERATDVFRIGVTPSAFLNVYPALQMNAAVNLSYKIQFNMEGGLIIAGSAFNKAKTNGYRIRPALRWYVTEAAETRFHLSIAYNIRYTKSQRVSPFSLQNGGFIAAFPYEQERKVRGPAFLVGLDYWFNKRIVLDVGFGIGLGRLNIIDIDTPPNSFKSSSSIGHDKPGKSNFPIFILNIRFQYAL
jgi:hypothetical protein